MQSSTWATARKPSRSCTGQSLTWSWCWGTSETPRLNSGRHCFVQRDYKLIQDVLSDGELVAISAAWEPIGYVTLRLGQALHQAIRSKKMSDVFLKKLNGFVSTMEDQRSLSDGILTTPMPFAYTAHARTFIFTYLGFLPFALFYHLHWFTIPSCTILGYCVIGLEHIATHVENPFGDHSTDIDLDAIVSNTKRMLLGLVTNLDQMEKESDTWTSFRKRARDGRAMWRADSDRSRDRSSNGFSAPMTVRSTSTRIEVGWSSLLVSDD